MLFSETGFPGLLIVEPRVFEDERGYFFEAYNESSFHKGGITTVFIQDNQSFSKKGIIRGLHFQRNPHAQAKLVRVIQGTILDVVVDIRKGSPTYGQSFGITLSSRDKKQLFIPRGFAHGFSVLSDEAEVLYKCDHLYNRESEGGIRYDDPALKIDWMVPPGTEIVSGKDLQLPSFAETVSHFEFEG